MLELLVCSLLTIVPDYLLGFDECHHHVIAPGYAPL